MYNTSEFIDMAIEMTSLEMKLSEVRRELATVIVEHDIAPLYSIKQTRSIQSSSH